MASKRTIIVNTLGAYSRTLASLFLGIFTARWVLEALGEVDFGLFAVVGTITTFITFFNMVMSMSCGRHLSYAVGQAASLPKDQGEEEVCKWFNAAMAVHTIIPLVLVIVGYPAGSWLIRHYLVIPIERLGACVWVFRLSLITAFFSMMNVPFGAIYFARQKIAEQSIYGVAQVILCCAFSYMMLSYPGDRLIFYSLYLSAIGLVVVLIYRWRTIRIFPETRIRLRYWCDWTKVRALFSFAGWNALGALGWMFKNQGLTILANKFYGAKVNAAMGIAQSVSGQVNSLAKALMAALQPEIVQTEGSGNRARMLRLSMSSNRFATLLLLVFCVPLCFEMEYILNLWLKAPPRWSVLFCQLVLLGMFFDNLTTGHAMAMGAKGQIAGYQITMGGGMMLCLPVAWLGGRFGLGPWWVLAVSATTLFFLSLGRVAWAKYLVGMGVFEWLMRVCLPFAGLLLLQFAFLTPIVLYVPSSFLRCASLSVLSVSLTIISAATFVLPKDERYMIWSKIRSRLRSGDA